MSLSTMLPADYDDNGLLRRGIALVLIGNSDQWNVKVAV